ncbi:MAG: hypothetical protein AB7R90_09855 [Reyranellaceae bacterium]
MAAIASSRQGLRLLIGGVLGLAVAGASSASAEDVDARTLAFLHDVAAPGTRLPAGADPAAVEAARAALRAERLLPAQRVATVDPGIVDQYARALLLGNRGPQFLPQIGKVRDAVLRRDRQEIGTAIGDVYEAAGRQRPTGAALDRLIDGVGGAVASEGPAESVRRRFDKPGHAVEITDARRAGLFTVDVTTRDAAGQATRTVFVGEQSSVPNARGTDLEQRLALRTACTVNAAQAAQMRAGLNGDWVDGAGEAWSVQGEGERIVLRHAGKRATLEYVGTVRLGRIEARHAIRSPEAMDGSLPGWVRAGLAGWNPTLYFVVRLDACPGEPTLSGTWQSQHVTYSPSFQTISNVHDPYELRLTLQRRASGRGMAALP